MKTPPRYPGNGPKPPWLRVKLGGAAGTARLEQIVQGGSLHTVCEEALCPNKGRCWEHGRATLMILGDTCSRGCRFCNVKTGASGIADAAEPGRVAEAVARMGLREAVLTSVTRDDLPDGGSAIWAETIRCVRARAPAVRIEVLVPDFGGRPADIARVVAERPDVWGHNLETVPSRYAAIRPGADYARSLAVLRAGHQAGLVVKTAIMVGLGESPDEVGAVMADARAAGCSIFYVGQYLRPTRDHQPVHEFVEPEQFDRYRAMGRAAGFAVVIADPLVRSSYHADEQAAYLDGLGPGGSS